MRMHELPPEMQPRLAKPPTMDEAEALLVALFLRRYVTYCARQRRYSQMNGAARLRAFAGDRSDRSARRPGTKASSARGSRTSAGMICGILGRVGTCRRARR